MRYSPSRYVEELEKRIENRYLTIKGNIVKNIIIHTYWWSGEKNYGDLLVPLLLGSYGFTAIHSNIQQSDAVILGSVIQWLNPDYEGYVIGCGLMHEKEMRLPKAKIIALRGKLTKECLGESKNVVLGDPGLLIRKLNIKRQKKKYLIGFVPHYLDKSDHRLKKLYLNSPKEIHLIDVQQNPIKTIREIDKCQYILSSSLHGIVASDALGIPNNWMLLSEKTTGTFKFHDYASALGTKLDPCILNGNESLSELINYTHSVSPKVEEVINDLNCLFNELRNIFIQNY